MATRAVALLLMVFGGSMSVYATSYTNAINQSSWRSVSTVFECRLEQSVPFFGEAVFRTRAGEASGFYLRSRSPRFQAGEAQLLARSPVWMPQPVEIELGVVPVKRGNRPLWLGSETTELMLAQLGKGLEVELVKDSWYLPAPSQPLRLSMNSIGFRPEYRKYLNCLSGLLPANFDQMRRSALYFPGGETEELGRKMTSKLDRMLKLVKHDKRIRNFYIDGHTDSAGDRADNLELSKQRAELVKQYLTRRGIPEDWITMRWHGERYPVASNGTAGGRAKNRRVTVRMERFEEIEVLPLAAAVNDN
ncbi:Outer membrane protein and related peptidoglycan-associated (lipo)proteins [Alteromonadaceae bacterium Bs31]|nr:Outer membrane protein and related peptidoglycan-associated (lipo)proteins [Alteromonadaceae bacterium Bs31]